MTVGAGEAGGGGDCEGGGIGGGGGGLGNDGGGEGGGGEGGGGESGEAILMHVVSVSILMHMVSTSMPKKSDAESGVPRTVRSLARTKGVVSAGTATVAVMITLPA